MNIGRPDSIESLNTQANATRASASIRTPEQIAKDRQSIQAVRELDSGKLFGSNSALTFFFDRQIQRAIVRVVNTDTNEVILQLPAERVVRMAEENQSK